MARVLEALASVIEPVTVHIGWRPQLRDPSDEMVLEAEMPGVGPVKFVGMPVKLSDTPGRLRRMPPTLGEHNDPVLAEAGMTPEQIACLKADGIVGSERDEQDAGAPARW